MNKILFITMYPLEMNTSATIQNLIIIKGLVKLGYKVDVISTSINKTHYAYDETIDLSLINNYYKLEIPKMYNSVRSKKNENNFNKMLKKFLKEIYNEFEIYDGYRTVIEKVHQLKNINYDYDFIISASDPKSSHLLAEKIIDTYKLNEIPWIQYWGDPLAIDITRKKKRFLEYRVKNEEERIISRANKIIYATPFTANYQSKNYPKFANKISFVTQGYWEGYLNNNILKEENKLLRVGYFGNYNPMIRDILPLYNSNNDNEFELLIGGNGMKLENKKNTKILGFLNHSDIKQYELSCDILVCLLNNKGTQIPGKIYYYASLNKPILIVKDGEFGQEIEKFLSKFNRYEFCENNESSILNAINKIKMNKVDKYKLPNELEPIYIAKQVLKIN